MKEKEVTDLNSTLELEFIRFESNEEEEEIDWRKGEDTASSEPTMRIKRKSKSIQCDSGLTILFFSTRHDDTCLLLLLLFNKAKA